MRTTALSVLFVLAGCAPTTIEVKDRRLATTTPVGVDSTRVCNGQPFGSGTIDFGKDLKEAGIDLSQGCIASGSFELVAEYSDIGPGTGCSAATGSVTLTGLAIEATCTKGLERQSLRTSCTSSRLEVADGTQVFTALNACLDEVERTQTEPFRKLINACKPTKLTLTAEGFCSADVCFSAKLLLGVATKNVVVQLGDGCP
ncbi:MAG: hypothetical protein JNJ54_28190 [Myxococcaceae bacterium]|nr:hypothetical protein [Myxococcaceae bacterium]